MRAGRVANASKLQGFQFSPALHKTERPPRGGLSEIRSGTPLALLIQINRESGDLTSFQLGQHR
jgi:hypothetical protein